MHFFVFEKIDTWFLISLDKLVIKSTLALSEIDVSEIKSVSPEIDLTKLESLGSQKYRIDKINIEKFNKEAVTVSLQFGLVSFFSRAIYYLVNNLSDK